MRILVFFVLLIMTGVTETAWPAPAVQKPPVNNAVPPCDDSMTSQKPPCHIDSDSVNIPPETPDERGVIVPPEVPPDGLPNREPPPGDPINDDTRDGHLKK